MAPFPVEFPVHDGSPGRQVPVHPVPDSPSVPGDSGDVERPAVDDEATEIVRLPTTPRVEHGSIEQDADVVIFLYRDEYYNTDSPDIGMAEVIIAKHRNGPTGTIRLAWLPRYTRFADMSRAS